MNRALIVTGSYRGFTGYDHYTRSIVRALHAHGIKIELRDLPNWSSAKLPESQQDQWFSTLQESVDANVHLHFCMPPQVEIAPGVRQINYTMFEADRIPDSWVEHSAKHDLVIVPTRSSLEAWLNSGVPRDKVAICPLGVDASLFSPSVTPLLFNEFAGRRPEQFRVRFLNVSEGIERKNLLGLLRAWLIATDANDDAALLLKPGFHATGSRARFFMRLHELETAVGKRLERAAPVFWLYDVLHPDAMPSLYTAATHYLSMSRGEGFDLPMVEAGVTGLQLIAPRHTAYLDYLNDDIAHLIPAVPREAKMPEEPGLQRLFAGAYWWEPDEDKACAIIRDIIDDRVDKKQSARESLSALSWSHTAERLEQLLLVGAD